MTAEQTQSDANGAIPQRLRQNVDVMLLLGVFLALIYVSLSYAPDVRQFPIVFLLAGTVFLTVELLAQLLPRKYAKRFETLTSGMAESIDSAEEDIMDEGADATRQTETDDARPDDAIGLNLATTQFRTVLAMVLLLVGYWVTAYLIGFLFSIPIYVFASYLFLGGKRLWHAVVTSAILMLIVYYFFGTIVNVPIMDGALI